MFGRNLKFYRLRSGLTQSQTTGLTGGLNKNA